MTYSKTISEVQTFTLSDAKYLASRIASDLEQMRLFYGKPDEEHIQKLVVEAGMLLKFGLLDWVRYGYRKDNEWVFAVSYTVNSLGQLECADDSPGGIDANADIIGASWYSHLKTRTNPQLTTEERETIEKNRPIDRVTAKEPGSANGTWVEDKTYYRNNTGLNRGQFRSL